MRKLVEKHMAALWFGEGTHFATAATHFPSPFLMQVLSIKQEMQDVS